MDAESKVQSDVVFHKIVVPHDLSRRADRAVQMAGTMAHPLRSEVIVMHVIDPNELRRNEEISYITQVSELARARWRQLQIAAKRLLPPNVTIDVRVLSGNPQNVILTEAEKMGADLLIITTSPLTGAGYPFTGETEPPESLAPCPVLTVSVTEEEESLLARHELRKVETHSLKQYCDVSRSLSKQVAQRRPVYLGYAQMPASPTGVCE